MVRSTCLITGGPSTEDDSATQWKTVFGRQEWLTKAPQAKRPWTEPKPGFVVLGHTVCTLRVILMIAFHEVETHEVGVVGGVQKTNRRADGSSMSVSSRAVYIHSRK